MRPKGNTAINNELLARLDERQIAMNQKLELIHNEMQKTDERVASLETTRNKLAGGVKATSIISAAIGGFVGFMINKFF